MNLAQNAWLPLWPQAASTSAGWVDSVFIGLFVLSVLICFLNYFLLAFFATRFRSGSAAPRGPGEAKSWIWEAGWTAATLVGFLALFFWGAGLYLRLYQAPPETAQREIYVVGKQWMWKIQHPDGQREINELHVPVNESVRLLLASQDVIHSFFIPAFRLKHDVVPGQYETLWFEATETGDFLIECTQFCGTAHANMVGSVHVMTGPDYERWLAAQSVEPSLAAQGEKLFRSLGCSGCHGENSAVHAPPLEGVFGSLVHLEDGSAVVADERYIHDSILLPASQIVAGYAPIMPSFAEQVSEEDVFKLVAYIKSLAQPKGAQPKGAPLKGPVP